jgi:hypothetical protein
MGAVRSVRYAPEILPYEQRLKTIVEAAEPDQSVLAIIPVEEGQVPHALK